jgi:hypothetical protein
LQRQGNPSVNNWFGLLGITVKKVDVGDVITLIDLGDGSFLLTPIVTQVDRLGDRVARAMAEAGVSEDELLAALDEERERYYQERYVQS